MFVISELIQQEVVPSGTYIPHSTGKNRIWPSPTQRGVGGDGPNAQPWVVSNPPGLWPGLFKAQATARLMGRAVSASRPNSAPGAMDSYASSTKTKSRFPLQDQLLQKRNLRENLDRFIPNRSAMDMDYAKTMLTDTKKGKENPALSPSPAREAYRKQLAETFNMNRARILAFKNKPPTPVEAIPQEFSSTTHQVKAAKPLRHIPQVECRFYSVSIIEC
ncbi:hypothetical protein RD792_013639 [Penstemon davidsonii]|uniref:Uncharacterized protein n=1 Tax=Penstemon davidsonii TaxID=160366 RepID=A0ABR0CVP9_9LAMI|nr:hypothetical protein RD792_013639 [Penstemon davidsonii]